MAWPGGDPDAVSWAWTGVAALSAVGGFAVALRLPPHDRSGRAFWWTSTVVVLVLCVNKELDLQSWVLDRVHAVFASYGWPDSRTDTLLVLVCLTVGAAAAAAATPLVATGAVGRFPVATGGIVLLTAHVAVRTVEISGVVPGFVAEPWLVVLLEFGGVAAILVSVLWRAVPTAHARGSSQLPRGRVRQTDRTCDGSAPR